jgi:hypothetical protein
MSLPRARSGVRAALVAGLLAALGGAARADPLDLPFGTNTCRAAIRAASASPDVDDYVASLLAGEKLSVSVRADRGSALLPKLTLVGPDSVEFAPASLVSRSGGRTAAFVAFEVPATGRWTVRIAGASSTEGAYVATFRITPAAAAKVHVSASTAGISVPFEGLDGALLDARVTWRDPSVVVRVVSVRDPQDDVAAGLESSVRRTSASIRKFGLHVGDGAYALRLATTSGVAECDVLLRVTPQGRRRKALRLAPDEPWVDPLLSPARGIAGGLLTVTGRNFDSASPPTVLFGTSSTPSTVTLGGTALSVVVPGGVVGGTTVALTVVASDGQSCTSADYFRYAGVPTVGDLVDGSGVSVRSGPAAGGATLTLRGTEFEAGQTVRFGSATATVLAVVGTTRLDVRVPAAPAGSVAIFVDDLYGRTGQAPFTYTYQ